MPDGWPLLIRADAGPRIGAGHVMRCLALAQAWRDTGGSVSFLSAIEPASLRRRLESDGFDVTCPAGPAGGPADAAATAAIALDLGASWVVVDGYGFSSDYRQAIRPASGAKLLVLDDLGRAGPYRADLLVNQNMRAREELYAERSAQARLLLGPRYMLLRSEFGRWRKWRRDTAPVARKLLVTLGGGEVSDATVKVLDALRRGGAADMEAVVLAPTRGRGGKAVVAAAAACPATTRLVDEDPDMPKLMAWADLAVAAGGGTCWEMAFMQLPAVLLVLADNQRPNAEDLAQAGVAVNFGAAGTARPKGIAAALAALAGDAGRRAEMSRRGRSLVDGRGSRRVVTEMLLTDCFRARPAGPADREMLFAWANDPQARSMSFSQRPIAWDEHVRWFEAALRESRHTMLIVEYRLPDGWRPAAVFRADAEGVVSFSLAREYRGQHLAEPALRAGIDACRARRPGLALAAHVKEANAASRQLFENVGFAFAGPCAAHDACRTYRLE